MQLLQGNAPVGAAWPGQLSGSCARLGMVRVQGNTQLCASLGWSVFNCCLHEQRGASTEEGDFVESVRKWLCKSLCRNTVFVGF